MSQAESFEFRSETKELLQLMAHALYSSKDVFLRELISNASDALDKRRFAALTDASAMSDDTAQLEIKVFSDKEARTLVIEDNGIGMSREELIENLGTIAHSGTKGFLEQLKSAKDQAEEHALIGQFGVGFYSSFIVASNVRVETRRVGAQEAYCFISKGDGRYTIESIQKDTVGTRIILELAPADPENNLEDFTQDYILRTTIKKYSDFIQYPIMLQTEEHVHKESTDAEHDAQNCDDPEHQETRLVWKQANSMKAIWLKSADEIEDKEYNEFYRQITHDWTDPIARIPIKAEGSFEYRGLLFIPGRAPFDLNYRDAKFGLRLHAQHVLIMEQCPELLPDYLRFVKGVVDSADLNLNISREILQKDRRINTIKKHLTKKVLDTLQKLAKDEPKTFATTWENYSRYLKEGVASDYENREKLLKLLRFLSTQTVNHDAELAQNKAQTPENTEAGDKPEELQPSMVTLEEYVSRMKLGQDAIYAIAGDSLESLKKSPHLEAFLKKEYEVLFLVDPYDEILFSQVPEFEGKKIQFIGRGEVELGTDEEKQEQRKVRESQEKDFEGLIQKLGAILKNDVSSVRVSTRLTSSPACLVGLEGDVSPHLQRILNKMGSADLPASKRILEINPEHALLEKLREKFAADPESPMIPKYATLLFGQSLLAEGSPLPDPVEYTKLVTELMVSGI